MDSFLARTFYRGGTDDVLELASIAANEPDVLLPADSGWVGKCSLLLDLSGEIYNESMWMLEEIQQKVLAGHFEFSKHAVDQIIARRIYGRCGLERNDGRAPGDLYAGDKW